VGSVFMYSGECIEKQAPSSGVLGVWYVFPLSVVVAVVLSTPVIPTISCFVDVLERSTFFVARPSPPVDLADLDLITPLPVGRTLSASSA